jgi:hypothetical protein
VIQSYYEAKIRAERRRFVDVDRLDGLLLGSVAAISGCLHLVDGFQYAVAPCHTATAGIAEIACMTIVEMMSYGIELHHHRSSLSIARVTS